MDVKLIMFGVGALLVLFLLLLVFFVFKVIVIPILTSVAFWIVVGLLATIWFVGKRKMKRN